MVEMAESIEDVRGTGRGPGRIVEFIENVEAIDEYDRGGESPLDLACRSGDDAFRNWLYEPTFDTAGIGSGVCLSSPRVWSSLMSNLSVASSSSRRSRGDFGGS